MCLQIWTTALRNQIWVATSIFIMMLGHGMSIGLTSSMLSALQAPDSHVKVDTNSFSWLVSALGIGCALSFFPAAYITATYGRRVVMIVGLLSGILGPLIAFLASDVSVLILARALNGAALGASGILGFTILGEYTAPEYRGVFLNLKSGLIFGGYLIVHTLGNYFHWRNVYLSIMVPYCVTILMICTWPESPAWLASKRRYEACTRSFYLMRGRTQSSTRELKRMIAAQEDIALDNDKTFAKEVSSFLSKFKKKEFVKPVWIYVIVAFLMQSSGKTFFPAYAMQIVAQMDSDPTHYFYYILCMDILMCGSAIASAIFVKIMKRRTLLFISGILSVVVLLAVSLYYFMRSKKVITDDLNVLVPILFGFYLILVNVGCTPICLALIGELFPLEHRATGASIAGILIGLFMFLSLKIMPIMLETLKIFGSFAVLAVSMSVCLLVLYIVLPETKDKTLQEIEDFFKNDRILHNRYDDDEETILTAVNIKRVGER